MSNGIFIGIIMASCYYTYEEPPTVFVHAVEKRWPLYIFLANPPRMLKINRLNTLHPLYLNIFYIL